MLNRVMGAVQIEEEKEDDVEPRSSLGIVDDERGKRMAVVGCWQVVCQIHVCTTCLYNMCVPHVCTTCTVHPEYLEYQNNFRRWGPEVSNQ